MKCAYCDKETEDPHRDHVVPRSRGGPDNATNIVMACAECNRAKRDRLATEWLGEDCPPRVARIEERVNQSLETRFKKRNKQKRNYTPDQEQGLFAFHFKTPGGAVDYIGVVLSETDGTIRIEAYDAIMLHCGFFQLSGALYDLPKSECRLFNHRTSCLESAWSINSRLLGKV